MSAAILKSFRRISRQLAAAGVPPVSPYWLGEAERFYRHPTARLLAECVGRGGDKSRTAVITAVAEQLAGDFRIPPGERHYHVHVAENRDEAAKTLSVLEQYLRILRVPFTRSGDTIELSELPRGFRVLACRVGAVSGFRCTGWTADECAKWDDEGADPSAEVIASIRAMTVTHPNARGRIVSSPLATLGYFYETWHAGDSADQIVGHAPSWVANPSITEEQTHALERDPRKHAREYRALPTEGSEESLFDATLLDRAQRASAGDVPPERGRTYFAAMDPSLGRNAFTFVIGTLRPVGGRTKASIVLHREWRAPKAKTLDLGAVLQAIASLMAPYGVTTVYTDPFHGESLAELATRMWLPIAVAVDKPTPTEKLERYEATLVRFLDDGVELPRDAQVRSDLLAVKRRIVKGSADRFTITMAVTADGRHADYAPAIVLVLAHMPRLAAAADAWRAKAARVLHGIALHDGDALAIARQQQIDTDRMTAARARTVNDPEWCAKANREWTEQAKRSQRAAWPAPRTPKYQW